MVTQTRRRRGFSLIELIVVIAVLGLLMSLGFAAIRYGRTASKASACLNNLREISTALNLYYNDHRVYPPEDLRTHLAPYLGDDSRVFICPSDPDPQGDSYSRHYVCRTDEGTCNYVCACPLHLDEARAVTLFTSSSTQLLEVQAVHWNGQPVVPATEVGGGALTFSDGSHVTIPTGMVIELVQSFRMRDGSLYSLIRVGVNETGTLDIEVTPGSRFEVITPAAIAGVQGTRFKVTTFIDGSVCCVKVDVSEGVVKVKDRWSKGDERRLTPGESKSVKIHRKKMRQLLKRKWKKRRKHLSDDYLYEDDDDD